MNHSLIVIECSGLGLMEQWGCARMQRRQLAHVCACWRGSSMEGAAMELKVSLSIHKWGVDIWMTSFACVCFLLLHFFFLVLYICMAHREWSSALPHGQCPWRSLTCIRVYRIRHWNVKVKAAYLNTAKDGWITKTEQDLRAMVPHANWPEVAK